MPVAGFVPGIQLNEAGEALFAPMETEALEEVDDGSADSLDVIIRRRSHHRFEGFGSGGESRSDLILGRLVARTETATARAAAAVKKNMNASL